MEGACIAFVPTPYVCRHGLLAAIEKVRFTYWGARPSEKFNFPNACLVDYIKHGLRTII